MVVAPNIEKYSDNILPLDRPTSNISNTSHNNITNTSPARKIEDTIEFKTANEHVKTSTFTPNLPIRQMDNCQDDRVHLRNCPSCRDYMKQLIETTDVKETFGNFFDINKTDSMVDLIALISIGILIIFVLDSFMRFGRSL